MECTPNVEMIAYENGINGGRTSVRKADKKQLGVTTVFDNYSVPQKECRQDN